MNKRKNASDHSADNEDLKPCPTNDDGNHFAESDDHFNDLDTGWAWVVLFAAFGALTNSGGAAYVVGIIHSVVLEKFQQSVAMTAWVGSLHSAVVSAGGPLSTAVIDRFSCRTAIIGSGWLSAIGFLCTAFAPKLEVAILTCGVIGGLGGALGYTAGMVVIGFNFKQKRSFALGVAVAGVGVGMFILAPIMEFSREYYGFTGFYIILAACALNNITFGMLCFPSKLEKEAKRRRKFDAMIRREESSGGSSCSRIKEYIRVICNKAIICLEISMFAYLFGIFIIFVYLPTYVVSKGSTQAVSSMMVALSGICTVIGRLAIGVVSNQRLLPDIWLYSGSMGIVSIATVLFPHYSYFYTGQVIYIVLLGLFNGMCYVLATPINITYVGVEYMAAAIGCELFFGGFGSVAGPVFSGFLVDSGGTYDQAFYIAGFSILVACLASAASQCFASKNSNQASETLEINVTIEKK